MSALPLNALRAFEAVGRHLSIRKAAEQLNVTPSAVSHQLRALEDSLGVALLRRVNRRLVLTEAGQLLLPGLRDGFASIAGAVKALEANRRHGVLTVSMLSTFAAGWFIPRLTRFQARHAEIEVRVATTTRAVDFDREDIDAAIRYGRGGWPGMRCDRLFGERIAPVCSPALRDGEPPLRRPEDLRRHTLLLSEARPDDWPLWLEQAGLPALEQAGSVRFDTTNFALEAAIAGAGVAIVARELAAEELAAGRLVTPFDREITRDEGYYLVCPAGRADAPKLAALREWLLDEAACNIA